VLVFVGQSETQYRISRHVLCRWVRGEQDDRSRVKNMGRGDRMYVGLGGRLRRNAKAGVMEPGMTPEDRKSVDADLLVEVRLGSERQNAEACAVRLRGGVDGGDGERLRARGCGALFVWESVAREGKVHFPVAPLSNHKSRYIVVRIMKKLLCYCTWLKKNS
jgi:hypothetical protein